MKGVYSKLRDVTRPVQQKLVEEFGEEINHLFVTRQEFRKEMSDVVHMVTREKVFLKNLLENRLMSMVSNDTLNSLVKGLNARIDNLYDAIQAARDNAVTGAKESITSTLNEIINRIAQNQDDIQKNLDETQELKTLLDTIVPQVMRTIDIDSLRTMVEEIVQTQFQAVTDKLNESITETETSGN